MPRAKSTTHARLICAGLTTGAVGAALFIAPSTAFAAVLTSLTPAGGPAGTVITAVAAATPFAAANPAAIFTTATACPTNYTTTATAPDVAFAAGNPTKVTDNTASFTVPAALPLNAGAAKVYKVCVYNGATTTSTLVHDGTPKTFTVTPAITTNVPGGPSGGGNPIVLTAPTGSTPFTTAAPGVTFSTAGCADTYGTPGTPSMAGTSVVKTSTSTLTANVPVGVLGTGPNTVFTACTYAGTSSSDALTGSTMVGAYNVSIPTVMLSSTVGSNAGGNSVTASAPMNFLLGVTSPGALFTTAATCPSQYTTTETTYSAGVTPTLKKGLTNGVRKVANNRLAVTMPAVPLINSSPTPYQVCFYNGTVDATSTLLATAAYTSTIVHTLTNVAPAAGSALGGDNIVVTGTGFPTAPGSINATLGGLPLAVMPISSTAFTAITPMHAVENGVPLVVTTSAGSKVLQAAYSYVNAVQVSPNTAPSNTTVDISVKGVGFLSTNFSTTSTDAHVYLTSATYDPRIVVASGNKINGAVAECGNVLVISDNELICTLNLGQRLDATGAVIAAAPRTSSADAVGGASTGRVVTSASAAFTPADIGRSISGTGIPTGTVILDVINATTAVISRQPGTLSTPALTIGGGLTRVAASVVTTNSSATVTAPAGTFTNADIGRAITGAGIPTTPTATTITAVTANGNGATLSASATAGATVSATVYNAPVPDGVYSITFVNDGSVDADSTNAAYSQSVVSSGSTFTVSSF